MDRKGIIAVALAIIALVWWTLHNQAEMEKYRQAKRASDAVKAAERAKVEEAAAQAAAPVAGTETGAGAAPAVPVTPEVPETTETLSTALLEQTFTSAGGGISRVVLKTHTGEGGRKIILNEFGSLPIGSVSDRAGEGVRAPYTAKFDPTTNEAVFERVDGRQLRTVKKFTLPKGAGLKEDYTTKLELTLTNSGAQELVLPPYYVYLGSTAPIHGHDMPNYTGFGWMKKGFTFKDLTHFTQGGFLGMGKTESPLHLERNGGNRWVGVTNQYFTTILTPAGATGEGSWARRYRIEPPLWKESGRSEAGDPSQRFAVEGAISMPGITLAAGQSATQSFDIYTGPREFHRLKSLGADQDEVMAFGVFEIVSELLLTSMNWLNARLGTYAAAIIVLTIIIKLLLYPLQNKATASMKKMQALQPKMTELREKYQDDPQRMNTELMKLYKDYGVNPFGGCLPMLIQIPIFFGFYNMLGKAVELRNSSFLWVNDLSQPDTVYDIAGLPINPLPLLMAGTMFWQMAITPKSGDPVQQRVFMFMPVIFVFFCYNFASALALYWTVQNIFSIVQLYLTRNQETPVLQKVTVPVKKKGRGR